MASSLIYDDGGLCYDCFLEGPLRILVLNRKMVGDTGVLLHFLGGIQIEKNEVLTFLDLKTNQTYHVHTEMIGGIINRNEKGAKIIRLE